MPVITARIDCSKIQWTKLKSAGSLVSLFFDFIPHQEFFLFCVVSPLVDLHHLSLPRGCRSSYLIHHNSFNVIYLATPSDVKVRSLWDSIEIECVASPYAPKILMINLRAKILNPHLPKKKIYTEPRGRSPFSVMIIGSYEFSDFKGAKQTCRNWNYNTDNVAWANLAYKDFPSALCVVVRHGLKHPPKKPNTIGSILDPDALPCCPRFLVWLHFTKSVHAASLFPKSGICVMKDPSTCHR